MDSPYIGVYEKLKRAEENIGNLDREIKRFFDEGEYATLPIQDSDLLLKAIAYHQNRAIPHRFSVLAGEIIHHLRSSLDHLAWQLSSVEYRTTHPRRIEFPICEKQPEGKELSQYKARIRGIIQPRAREVIENLQPYKSADPLDHPLLVVHKMNVIDKHRELVICVSVGLLEVPYPVVEQYIHGARADAEDLLEKIYPHVKQYGRVTPQVAFRNFGQRKIAPVIPALHHLAAGVRDAISLFAEFE